MARVVSEMSWKVVFDLLNTGGDWVVIRIDNEGDIFIEDDHEGRVFIPAHIAVTFLKVLAEVKAAYEATVGKPISTVKAAEPAAE